MINGVLPESGQQNDPLAMAIVQREQKPDITRRFIDHSSSTLFLQPVNMVGVPALKVFCTRFEPAPLSGQVRQQFSENMSFSELVNDIARSEHGLIMLMGKRRRGENHNGRSYRRQAGRYKDSMCILQPPILLPTLTLPKRRHLTTYGSSGINPQEETERYRQHVLETKEKDDLDEAETTAGKRIYALHTEEIYLYFRRSRA